VGGAGVTRGRVGLSGKLGRRWWGTGVRNWDRLGELGPVGKLGPMGKPGPAAGIGTNWENWH